MRVLLFASSVGVCVALSCPVLAQPPSAPARGEAESAAQLDPPPARSDQGTRDTPDDEGLEGESVPPPPAPTAGYGTPVYPSPEGPSARTVELDEGVRLPSNLSTRIRVLDSSLQVLAARGSSRIVDGVLSLVTGGVSIGIGIWARAEGYPELARYAIMLGVVSLIRGGLDLGLSPNPRTPAIQYAHMPMRTRAEANARLAYGETALEMLARRTRAVRLIDASLSIVSGVAVIPIFLHAKDYRFTGPLDYFIVIAAGISVITGIINLATRSDAERRWSAYEDLRDQLEAEEEGGFVVREDRSPRILGVGFAPVPGGATAGVGVGWF